MSWVKTHQLPRHTTTGTFDLQVIRSCTLKCRKLICQPGSNKQIIFSLFVPFLNLGGIAKDLMTGPMGNCVFCFPETPNVL